MVIGCGHRRSPARCCCSRGRRQLAPAPRGAVLRDGPRLRLRGRARRSSPPSRRWAGSRAPSRPAPRCSPAPSAARSASRCFGAMVNASVTDSVGHGEPRPRAPLPERARAGDPRDVRLLRRRRGRPARRQPADAAPDRALSGLMGSLTFLAGRAWRGDDAAMTLPDEVDVSELEPGPHEDEPHEGGLNNRLNWLRAGVLGANDGIVSTAGIVIGVVGATSDRDRDPDRRRRRPGRRRDEHGRRGVRLGQHPARLRAGAAGQGAPRAARRAGGGARGAGRPLRREGAERGARPRGRPSS